MKFNIHDAKTHFSKLVAAVERGEKVVIYRRGVPIMECSPVKGKAKFPFGAFSGLVDGDVSLDHMSLPTDKKALEEMGL